MDLPTLESTTRRELLRFRFRPAQRVILEVILLYSWARGRKQATIPDLRYLAALTGLRRDRINKEIDALEHARVIYTQRQDGLYQLLPDSRQWQVTANVVATAAEEAEAVLERRNEQLPLIARERTLNDALANVALDEVTAPPAPTANVTAPESRDWRDYIRAMRDEVECPAAANAAKDSIHAAECRKPPDLAPKPPRNPPPPERTNIRLDVNDVCTKKRITSRDGRAADVIDEVRAFVGEHDWRRYWTRYTGYLERNLDVVEQELGYARLKLDEGVKVKKSKGAMLWSQIKTVVGG